MVELIGKVPACTTAWAGYPADLYPPRGWGPSGTPDQIQTQHSSAGSAPKRHNHAMNQPDPHAAASCRLSWQADCGRKPFIFELVEGLLKACRVMWSFIWYFRYCCTLVKSSLMASPHGESVRLAENSPAHRNPRAKKHWLGIYSTERIVGWDSTILRLVQGNRPEGLYRGVPILFSKIIWTLDRHPDVSATKPL